MPAARLQGGSGPGRKWAVIAASLSRSSKVRAGRGTPRGCGGHPCAGAFLKSGRPVRWCTANSRVTASPRAGSVYLEGSAPFNLALSPDWGEGIEPTPSPSPRERARVRVDASSRRVQAAFQWLAEPRKRRLQKPRIGSDAPRSLEASGDPVNRVQTHASRPAQ